MRLIEGQMTGDIGQMEDGKEKEMKRMTWKEICARYPNQHVGLSDVEWDNGSTVKSAVVKYSNENSNRADIVRMAVKSNGSIVSKSTSHRSLLKIWKGGLYENR